MSKPRLVVLLSGSGSNLQAFIDAQQNQSLDADLVAVISNKEQAYGLVRAQEAGIATAAINHKDFASRELFDQALAAKIQTYQPDLIILAGFMRILTPEFVAQFKGRLLNIHPSLLPKYPGLHTHQRAIDAGDNQAGASVHFVTEELDGGPVILQAKVDVSACDNADELAARVLIQEHKIYPIVAQWFLSQRLKLEAEAVIFDGKALDQALIFEPSLCWAKIWPATPYVRLSLPP